MATQTRNLYGKIIVTNGAISDLATQSLSDCYGVHSGQCKTVLVTEGNKIHLELEYFLMFGVTPQAVQESVRDTVKYNLEQFTGMKVVIINQHVKGVK